MVTKKVRTEYMKKFRDPKWETFSKCYEDSLKYRLTRRLMEHSHKPWFWEGWEGGSVLTSGRSTPRHGRNRVAPVTPAAADNRLRSGLEADRDEDEDEEAADVDAHAAPADVPRTENAVPSPPNVSGASDQPNTDDGPPDSPDSNGEPAEPEPAQRRQRRHRRRTPNSEQGGRDGCQGNKSPADRKTERAKSQPPPGGASDNPCEDERAKKSATSNNSERCDASVQTTTATKTTRPRDKRPATGDRRRARSADPDKLRRSQRSQLTASAAAIAVATADERWVTEYMRCFSARVR
ncbi:uncharacterized protein ccsapa [Festucalex cinctus]